MLMNVLTPRKNRWVLTREAFDQLLARLDGDRELAGAEYENIRRKLVKFFEWHGCDSPEDYADETINRVARKIDEGEVVQNLRGYFTGVARMLWLDRMKEKQRDQAAFERLPPPPILTEDDEPESRFECFEECLESLSAENREMIVEYYREEKSAKIEARKKMADALGILPNALRIRAHRIKAKLEECVRHCMNRSEATK
jgi:RNA polymerase sigma factor (sigma-70 family)